MYLLSGTLFFFLLKILFIYFKERQRAQARGRVRGRNRLPTEQRAQHGARSQDLGIVTWAEGRHLTFGATLVSLFLFLTADHLSFLLKSEEPSSFQGWTHLWYWRWKHQKRTCLVSLKVSDSKKHGMGKTRKSVLAMASSGCRGHTR